MSGRLLGERLGRWAFWIVFIGFNVAFLPMHLTGLLGMPRRIWTYAPDAGWSTVNMISSVGAFILGFGILLVLINILMALRHGKIAGPNPWDAPTLEWSIPSPPPPYNFARIPAIASRHPLWEERLGEGSGRSMLDRGFVLDDGKETLATTVIDAEPDAILKMPEDSPWPFITTVIMAVLFTGIARALRLGQRGRGAADPPLPAVLALAEAAAPPDREAAAWLSFRKAKRTLPSASCRSAARAENPPAGTACSR
jgi:cytochrome c oxidase subunit 1/cytochrome c oxidase subunit I+III